MISVGPAASSRRSDGGPAKPRWRPVVEGVSLIVLEQPPLWLVALAGFLVRGGVIVFALPIVVLPSAVGVANFIGPTSVTAAGPSGRLIALFAFALLVGIVWLTVALIVGSLVDRTVIMGHLEAMGVAPSAGSPPRLLDLIGIRLLLLIPIAIAVAWASGRLTDAGYQELILPTNLSTGLALRVSLRAGDALAVVAVVWLASESLVAMAVRRSVIERARPARALRNAVGHLVRHPASTIATTFLSVGVSVAVVALAVLALSVSWSALRVALVEDIPQFGIIVGLAGFLAVWLGSLVLAGILSAWRSGLWTGEMVRFDIARSGDM